MILTIAIPTYNRNQILRENIVKLLPQLTPECQLLILDNCSDIPVAEALSDIFTKFPHTTVRCIRNRINIGGNANIIRCLEFCETDWLWILSDAYEISLDSIRIIMEHIHKYGDCIYINFSSNWHRRKNACITSDLYEFLRNIDDFGHILNISCSVFRANVLLHALEFGYHYSYTLAPHIAVLLRTFALQPTYKCCFSNEITIMAKNSRISHSWSMSVYPYVLALAESDLPLSAQIVLLDHIRKDLYRWLPTIVIDMIHENRTRSNMQMLYKYDLFRFRYFYNRRNWLHSFTFFMLRLLLVFPPLANIIMIILKGKRLSQMVSPSGPGF